jgi:uncharacterized membrane protein YeaQ/YmgE (transglycosylase-associated protein family)
MYGYEIFTFFCALGLALTHVYAGKLMFLASIPRSKWLSLGSGVSVAYVFVHIFPELNERQSELKGDISPLLDFTEHHVYLLALIGFTAFYALERLIKVTASKKPSADASARSDTDESKGFFWLHMASFAVYNMLIGYLLVEREDKELKSLGLFFIALLLHFIVNDFGLRQHHQQTYDNKGRWVLSFAVMAGWAASLLIKLEMPLITTCFAFLSGSIVLNVMKEELPEDRKSSSWAFMLGAFLYSVLLLTL